jgi:hypothetical protein
MQLRGAIYGGLYGFVHDKSFAPCTIIHHFNVVSLAHVVHTYFPKINEDDGVTANITTMFSIVR